MRQKQVAQGDQRHDTHDGGRGDDPEPAALTRPTWPPHDGARAHAATLAVVRANVDDPALSNRGSALRVSAPTPAAAGSGSDGTGPAPATK
jgi:hypothetical protein